MLRNSLKKDTCFVRKIDLLCRSTVCDGSRDIIRRKLTEG